MQSIWRGMWCAALLVVAGAAAAEERWIAEGRGTLVIDRDGSVAAVDVSDQFDPVIEAAVVEQVRAWRFEPIVEQGRPVQVEAQMGFELHAFAADHGRETRLTIADVSFYDPPAQRSERVGFKPPKYPAAMLRKQLGAHVRLLVEIGADGRVLRAAQRSGRLYANRDEVPGAERAMREFARMSIAAVEQWRFAPAPDGQPYKVTVPITFKPGDARWQRAHAVAVTPEPWVVAAGAEAVAAYGEYGAAPDPRVRLQTALEDGAAGS